MKTNMYETRIYEKPLTGEFPSFNSARDFASFTTIDEGNNTIVLITRDDDPYAIVRNGVIYYISSSSSPTDGEEAYHS